MIVRNAHSHSWRRRSRSMSQLKPTALRSCRSPPSVRISADEPSLGYQWCGTLIRKIHITSSNTHKIQTNIPQTRNITDKKSKIASNREFVWNVRPCNRRAVVSQPFLIEFDWLGESVLQTNSREVEAQYSTFLPYGWFDASPHVCISVHVCSVRPCNRRAVVSQSFLIECEW